MSIGILFLITTKNLLFFGFSSWENFVEVRAGKTEQGWNQNRSWANIFSANFHWRKKVLQLGLHSNSFSDEFNEWVRRLPLLNSRRVRKAPTFSALLTFRRWISHCFTRFSNINTCTSFLHSTMGIAQNFFDISCRFLFVNGIIVWKISLFFLFSFLDFLLHNEHYELYNFCFFFIRQLKENPEI